MHRGTLGLGVTNYADYTLRFEPPRREARGTHKGADIYVRWGSG